MISWLVALLQLLVDRYILPPVDWWINLPFYDTQLPVYLALLVVQFFPRLSVLFIVGADTAIEQHKDVKHLREWRRYFLMSPARFDSEISDLAGRREALLVRAESLEARAIDNMFGFIPNARRNMLRVAAQRREEAANIEEEVARKKALWAHVIEARLKQNCAPARVIGLIEALASDDDTQARHALAALHAIRHGDWLEAIPKKLPPQDRPLVVNCLRMMAGTDQVNEARAACYRLFRILQHNHMQWKDLAT